MKVSHLDFEARSGVDITEVGSHRWSIDPQFEIFMASVSRDDEDKVYLWINPKFRLPGQPDENVEAERILAESDIVYAHSAQNEQANTWGAITQRKACPFKTEPPLTIWRCTAAQARKAGLPYSLEKISATLNLDVQKDKEGKALIKFFCIPDEETGKFNEPKDHPEKWLKFCAYCVTDTVVEKLVGKKLKSFELTGAALATFQFDLRMNQRGIPINLTAARNAQKIIDQEQAGVVQEFRKLTGLNPTQGKKFKAWLEEKCLLALPNLQAATVEDTLKKETPRRMERIERLKKNGFEMSGAVIQNELLPLRTLGMFQKVSYAAVKKVQTMLDCTCPDGFARGMFMYYGAGTGRWSAQKLQPHNFKKTDKEFRPLTDGIYHAICRTDSAGYLDDVYGPPLECIANCIRNFIHLPGREMLDGDYSGVEARIIAWLAGQEDALKEWIAYDNKTGPKPYQIMAAYVYQIPVDKVDSYQLELGKQIVLGAGFQLGAKRFKQNCWDKYQLDFPLDLCKKGIKGFRKKNSRIRDYWWRLNDAAITAIETRGKCGEFTACQIAGIPYLLARLKSGRSLAYPFPEVNLVQWTPEIDEDDLDESGNPIVPKPQWRKEVTYWGEIKQNVWGRVKIYGGKFAENFTQATAADFMAHGAIVAESRGMAPFMLVHDQGLAVRTGNQTVQDYERALGDLPPWAKGFPMRVEGKVTKYYKK